MPGHVRQLDARLVSEVPVLRDGEPVVVGDELEGVVGDGEKGFRRERGLREGVQRQRTRVCTSNVGK